MKKILSFLVFSILCFSLGSSAFAQWSQRPGDYYAKVQVTGMQGEQAFDREGELVPVKDFSILTLGLYGEFGIDNATTLSAAMGAGHTSYADQSTLFLAPVMIGATNQLYLDESLAIATLTRGGFSAGYNHEDLAIDNAFLDFRISTELAYIGETFLQVGMSFGDIFTAFALGGRYHSAYGIDLLANASVGYALSQDIVMMLTLSYNHALEKPKIINIAGSGATRYLGMNFGVGWWMSDHFGMLFEGSIAPYAISNAGAVVANVGLQFR